MKEEQEKASRAVDAIIRNMYRTLMTRGQKGCYVFCTDTELAAYLKARLHKVYETRKETKAMFVAEGREDYKR